MAAQIKFYAGEGATINELAGSGLGFFADSGFGASVSVGAWQGRTYITNNDGTVQGPECDNIKYVNPTSCIIGQTGTPILLRSIPNYMSTLNVRFTNDSAVKVQNAQFRIYDRVSINSPANGVTTAVYEVSHLDSGQTAIGSGGPGTPTSGGQHAWYMFPATGASPMSLTASPGISGTRISGSNTTQVRHDWYLSVSCSPDSIGSKLFAANVSLEFL